MDQGVACPLFIDEGRLTLLFQRSGKNRAR